MLGALSQVNDIRGPFSRLPADKCTPHLKVHRRRMHVARSGGSADVLNNLGKSLRGATWRIRAENRHTEPLELGTTEPFCESPESMQRSLRLAKSA